MDFTEQYTHQAEEKMLLRKIKDLIDRSERSYQVLYSHFLTPAEQMLISRVDEFLGKISFVGGYEDAERRMCRIQTAEYEEDKGAPLTLYSAELTASDAEISHRDVLGSLLGLGVKREMIGDILVSQHTALFFCDDTVAAYIEMNLERISRYRVQLHQAVLSELPQPEKEKAVINISSPRLDSICAECFHISRSKAADAIRKGLVSVNWQVCDQVARELKGGEKIALRGKGKVMYLGITGTSKKGRCFAGIERYV